MLDPPGKVNSFVRGCEDEPIVSSLVKVEVQASEMIAFSLKFLDEVLEDDKFRTYYRSCTTDLCNDCKLNFE